MIILRLVTARFSKTMCKWVAALCVYMISGKWMQCATNLVTHYTMLILFRLQLVITRRTQQRTVLSSSHLSLQWFFMDLILFFHKPSNPVDWIHAYLSHIFSVALCSCLFLGGLHNFRCICFHRLNFDSFELQSSNCNLRTSIG